jgi:hypothetical protein
MKESLSKFEPLTEAGLDGIEIAYMLAVLDSENPSDGDDFYGSPAYDKLFNYFLDNQLMPYGVAKCRTGEPDVWILDYLEELA